MSVYNYDIIQVNVACTIIETEINNFAEAIQPV